MSHHPTPPSCSPQAPPASWPPDVMDCFRSDCAGDIPPQDDLEDFWGEAWPEIEGDLEARLAFFSP